ncbi:MAG: aspartate aminotransferase family protein [Gammaproteobacteria bacterium]|nr:aspartate aminotransferase family protein [Gammaproteobacteria bacterium]
MSDTIMKTYNRIPLSFTRGEGAYLFDADGRQFLDAVSGVAVCCLGHAHPAVSKAICEQANTLVHTSNLFQIPLQQQLADRLTKLAGMDKIFFGNSGAEANEAAIKIARLYGNKQGIKNPAIIVTESSFHGRTLATLSATGNRKVQAGFEPLVQGFLRVPYNDLEAIRRVAEHNNQVVAILVEPIQGEGGVNIPDANYLDGIREICDQHNWLMMLDEIQTGMGRTGKWFGYQHGKSTPDVITLAKALGNGVPIGACLARGPAADVLGPGNHGSTFGGNPLACAAALAVVETLEKEKLIQASATTGEKILAGFRKALEGVEGVVNIRGKGMILGIELDRPCAEMVQRCIENSVLVNVTSEKVVRLLPPLNLSSAQADTLVKTVSDTIKTFLQESSV